MNAQNAMSKPQPASSVSRTWRTIKDFVFTIVGRGQNLDVRSNH